MGKILESENLCRSPDLKKAYDARWRAANKAAAAAYGAAWWAKNRDRKLAEAKQKRVEGRDSKPPPPRLEPGSYEEAFRRAYQRCNCSMRRARRKKARVPGVGIPALLPYYLRAVQLERRTGIAWDVDHIEPYAAGGKHRPDNLQILPRVMNALKRTASGTIPLGVPTKQELEDAWQL